MKQSVEQRVSSRGEMKYHDICFRDKIFVWKSLVKRSQGCRRERSHLGGPLLVAIHTLSPESPLLETWFAQNFLSLFPALRIFTFPWKTFRFSNVGKVQRRKCAMYEEGGTLLHFQLPSLQCTNPFSLLLAAKPNFISTLQNVLHRCWKKTFFTFSCSTWNHSLQL